MKNTFAEGSNYCVIGYPIKHSLSPQIHNRAFKHYKINAKYKAVSVKPEDLAEFMRNFRQNFAGANVTVPYKEKIMRFLDKVDKEARKIGAVNTIINRNGKLIGFNTDVYGAMEALKKIKNPMPTGHAYRQAGGQAARQEKSHAYRQAGKIESKKAVILGAGGAARAVVYGLKKSGAKIVVLNRTLSRAKKLAKEFRCASGALSDFRKFAERGIDILINATSLGMRPNSKKTPLPDLRAVLAGFKKKPIAMDIVYSPRMTKFLRDAEAAGCRIITGDKMFLAQAAKSFELWTGKKADYLFKNSDPVTSGGGGVSSSSCSP